MQQWFSFRATWIRLFAASACVLIPGCSSPSLSPSAVRMVSVAHQSQLPTKRQIVYSTSGQTAAVVTSVVAGGLVGGAIASAVASSATSDVRTQIMQRMYETGADPGLIVAGEWEKQLKEHQFYPVVPAGGDAEFRVEIQTVGLVGSGRRLYPALSGEAKLVRRDGKVLWQDLGEADGKDARLAMVGYPLDQYMQHPGLMRDAFGKAARIFCRDLLDRFRDEYRDATYDDVDRRRQAQNKEWAHLSKAERRQLEAQRDAEELKHEQEEDQSERDREKSEKDERVRAKAERRRLEQERRTVPR